MMTNIYVVPFQARVFPIYVESPIVSEQHRPVDYIELCEIYEIGKEYVFCHGGCGGALLLFGRDAGRGVSSCR